MKVFKILLVSLVLAAAMSASAFAQSAPVIPNFWDPQERLTKPNVKELPRMRFLTTTDFPPFSFIDKQKRLSGFHVDLARAICNELDLISVCQIQALPFGELEAAVTGGQGEAVLAGLASSQTARRNLTFSRPYFRIPARFIAKTNFPEPLITSLANKPVGIVEGTAHAAFARAQFGDMHLRLFATPERALQALKADKLVAVFGDSLALSFWLQTEQNRAAQAKQKLCCAFIGGPYLSSAYFGKGLTLAMPKGNIELEEAINFALKSIKQKGIFDELYLRYFPISLY